MNRSTTSAAAQSRFAFSPELIVDLFAGANVGELLAMEQLERAA